jgi:hypothetical protein
MRVYRLGTLAGLRLSARPSALFSALVLWIVLSGVGFALLALAPLTAILIALLAVALHWLSELFHQLGHAKAARRTGYPMMGIEFWLLLSSSLYPPAEPNLPARTHIRRALGGPIASLVFTALAGLATLALHALGNVLWWAALFFLLDNLLVFTLGALLPLGFTDGSTLLYWRREGKRESGA